MKKAIIALSIAFLVGMSGMASATQITFGLGIGGTVNYAGGGLVTPNALTTVGGVLGSVDGGSVSGMTLDFTTGNYVSGSTSGGTTTDVFAGGGNLTIGSLLSATFDGNSTLTIASASGVSGGTFIGDLNITHLDGTLASANGWSLPPSGDGIITQVELSFAQVPAPGAGFSALQMGGSVILTQVAPVPEPASLILMGSGLIGLALYGRKRSQNVV